jgi:hypothetical protein
VSHNTVSLLSSVLSCGKKHSSSPDRPDATLPRLLRRVTKRDHQPLLITVLQHGVEILGSEGRVAKGRVHTHLDRSRRSWQRQLWIKEGSLLSPFAPNSGHAN